MKFVVHYQHRDDTTGEISHTDGRYFEYVEGKTDPVEVRQIEAAALNAFANRCQRNLDNIRSLAHSLAQEDYTGCRRIW